MTTSQSLTRAQARRIALAAQGFVEKRPTGRVDRRHLLRVLDRIGRDGVDVVGRIGGLGRLGAAGGEGEQQREEASEGHGTGA